MEDLILTITLCIIIGTLFAIVYCLRYIVLIDRKIENIERHLDKLVHKTLTEEKKIERLLNNRKKKRR